MQLCTAVCVSIQDVEPPHLPDETEVCMCMCVFEHVIYLCIFMYIHVQYLHLQVHINFHSTYMYVCDPVCRLHNTHTHTYTHTYTIQSLDKHYVLTALLILKPPCTYRHCIIIYTVHVCIILCTGFYMSNMHGSSEISRGIASTLGGCTQF